MNAVALQRLRVMLAIKRFGWQWWSAGRHWKIKPSQGQCETNPDRHSGDNLKCLRRVEAKAQRIAIYM